MHTTLSDDRPDEANVIRGHNDESVGRKEGTGGDGKKSRKCKEESYIRLAQ